MTPAPIDRLFLEFSASKLRELASRIETCLTALSDEQVWSRGGENENAVGNLVLHLCGNVRQWVISNIGGVPDERQRDAEFAARAGISNTELRDRLTATVGQAVTVIESVTAPRMSDRMVIQGYSVTVLEAIYHVVEHFSMHTGQIIFATKMLTGADLGFYQHLQSSAKRGGKRT